MSESIVAATAPSVAPATAAAEGAKAPVTDQAGTPPGAAVKAAEAKAEAKAEARRLKFKMDGQDLDLSEEEVISLAQKGGTAQKRWEEAAQLRKQAESVLEYLKANPREALAKLGIDVRKMSEEHLLEELQREQESPEAKKVRETEEKLRKYETAEKAREEAAARKAAEDAEAEKQAQATAKEREIMERYDNIFTTALEKSGLPRSPATILRMAQLQRVNLRKGLELNADSLAKIVREDYDAEFQERTSGMDGDKLLEFLGKDIVGKLTKAQIAKLKAKPAAYSKPVEQSEPEVKQSAGKAWREWTKGNRSSRT